ncbi:MAG: abortive infection protein [Spirochaetes bacterium GWC2_52_13]|nr:MAG: abortive infection protein [Spirochaetes bacterium GWC2_52_13]HCG62824.1 ATP-binding protein [Sphaerochaeta sp.]
MILEFSIKNYKVFKDRATMSFVASNYDKSTLENQNVKSLPDLGIRILNSAVLYGANASGKTKFFEALEFMRRFVRKSSKEGQKGEMIPIQPFLLSEATEHEPSEFEVVFVQNGIMYRYGFECTNQAVLSEWLFFKPKTRETQIFYRDTVDKHIEVNQTHFKKGDLLINADLVRDNALMVSVGSQFNDEICNHVVKWFTQDVACLSCMHESGYKSLSLMQTDQNNNHDKILDLLRRADLHIQDINVETLSPDNLPNSASPELRAFLMEKLLAEKTKIYSDVITSHHKYDIENKIIGSTLFSLEKEESHGTQKFFYLSGPILDVLEQGKTLFIDELDARLHPNLVQRIFSLFNNPKINCHGAQLVATTHNTSLLRSDRLRKDQIWFVEKDNHEAAHLYSLADFKSTEVRSNENYETNYLRGKYGATPYLQELDNFKNRVSEEER